MGSSLPHVWTTNETKPRLITVAPFPAPLGAMVTFSIYRRDYYRGVCGTKGNAFSKTAVSRGGGFIAICIHPKA